MQDFPLILIFGSVSVFVLIFGIFVYEWVLRYRIAVNERLQSLSKDSIGNSHISIFKDLKQTESPHLFQLPSVIERLQHVIEQSGVECSVSTFALLSLCSGVTAACLASTHVWWLSLVALPLGLVLPGLVLLQRRNVRIRRLTRQLPEAFALISRAVRSGQTVQTALRIIAEDFDPPISQEFALCYEQQNLGVSRETTLRKLAARSNIMELQIFVVALLVQARSGGNLVELLDNLAMLIRKRLSMTDRVRALTGEVRAQATTLIVLPILVLLGIIFFAPEYSQELLSRPWLLGGMAVAQVLGALWIRRVVNFQY